MTSVVDPVRASRGTGWRVDAAVLAVGAVLLRLPAFFAARHLTFDDGQYGTVVLGLRDGSLPFRDLFSSQGPLYYPLLGVADLVGFRTIDGPRLLPVAAGAVAAVASYAIARHMTGRAEALLAGALVATSGSILYVTGPLSGDGPAIALALAAVALACRYRTHPSAAVAVGIGVAMGAALCVKLLVLPAAIPIAVVLVGRARRDRRGRDLAISIGSAVAVGLAASLPWGIGRVWDQSVAYHRDSHRLRSYGGNAWTLVETLATRDPFVLAAAFAAAVTAAVVVWRRRRGEAVPAGPVAEMGRRDPLWLLAPWAIAQAAFLVIEPAMWRPHVSQIVAPLALLSVLRPAPWRVLAVLGVLVLPVWAVNARPMLWPERYSRSESAVVRRLEALPADVWVISDDPGFAWRAGHRVPGAFVDVSMKRFQQGSLNTDVVARAAAGGRVCAVLIWSRDRLGSLTDLGSRLRRLGYDVVARYPGPTDRILYEIPGCVPSSSRRSGR